MFLWRKEPTKANMLRAQEIHKGALGHPLAWDSKPLGGPLTYLRLAVCLWANHQSSWNLSFPFCDQGATDPSQGGTLQGGRCGPGSRGARAPWSVQHGRKPTGARRPQNGGMKPLFERAAK